jgi:nucleotide-binding universal stress UspA family protein
MTALKDILVHLDGSPGSDSRLDIAADLAMRHGAHLTGLFVAEIALPVGLVGDPGGAAAVTILEQMREAALAEGARAEAVFEERLRREGIGGEWRALEGSGTEIVPLHARYADLVILGQQDPDGPSATGAVLEAALFGAGRPVLVVPHIGRFERVGRHVLIAWNASREAARALGDALPLIADADRTTVLAVNPRYGLNGHGEEPAADIALHLARHGLKATAEQILAPEIDDGEALLNAAAERDADLLVMGAYGHSPLREMVLGGVTRTLLRSMTLPVLLSH